MGNLTLTPATTIDTEIREEARETIGKLHDAEPQCFVLRTALSEIPLPADLSGFLMGVLQQIASGEAVGVQSLPEELTTTTAAQRLGVSRPTLMKMIKRGELEAYRVGSHTRLKTSVVLDFARSRQEARKDALAKMLDDGYRYSGEG
ncbi:helix-turn-helix domain-containing protein [Microbacterium paraoxydans]|uniref:helix-turn-helix domain-containing protein n=1 Tax=Microbacterium paraoxydans TaxID=199592 RepID=UPI003D73B360